MKGLLWLPSRGHSTTQWGRHGDRSERRLLTLYPLSRSRERDDAGTQLMSSFLLNPAPKTMDHCHPHSEWIFPHPPTQTLSWFLTQSSWPHKAVKINHHRQVARHSKFTCWSQNGACRAEALASLSSVIYFLKFKGLTNIYCAHWDKNPPALLSKIR